MKGLQAALKKRESFDFQHFFLKIVQGQLISKALFAILEFSQKNEQTVLSFFAIRSNYLVKSNAVRSFFGRIYGAAGAPIYFRFNLTFILTKALVKIMKTWNSTTGIAMPVIDVFRCELEPPVCADALVLLLGDGKTWIREVRLKL